MTQEVPHGADVEIEDVEGEEVHYSEYREEIEGLLPRFRQTKPLEILVIDKTPDGKVTVIHTLPTPPRYEKKDTLSGQGPTKEEAYTLLARVIVSYYMNLHFKQQLTPRESLQRKYLETIMIPVTEADHEAPS